LPLKRVCDEGSIICADIDEYGGVPVQRLKFSSEEPPTFPKDLTVTDISSYSLDVSWSFARMPPILVTDEVLGSRLLEGCILSPASQISSRLHFEVERRRAADVSRFGRLVALLIRHL
jgi:hypothetical protein